MALLRSLASVVTDGNRGRYVNEEPQRTDQRCICHPPTLYPAIFSRPPDGGRRPAAVALASLPTTDKGRYAPLVKSTAKRVADLLPSTGKYHLPDRFIIKPVMCRIEIVTHELLIADDPLHLLVFPLLN